MSRFSPVLLVSTCLTLGSCATDIGPTDLPQPETLAVHAWVGPNPDPANVTCTASGCVVSPTGDVTGVADADNIEYALDQVSPAGTEVVLSDGDASTMDEYFVSRNVVAVGFAGTLRGEGMDNTVVNGVRRSPAPGDGFASAPSLYWQKANPAWLFPTVFQFDYPAGSVTIRDLAVHVSDPEPADPYAWQTIRTKMNTLVEILGGDHSTTIENVRLRGAAGSAGAVFPSNTYIGVHVMLGDVSSPPIRGTGALRVRNLDLESVDFGVLFMFFEASQLDIADVTARDVVRGVDLEGIHNSATVVSGADIEIHPAGNSGIFLFDIPSGAEITGNTITGSRRPAIQLRRVNNATVTDNTIREHYVSTWWAAAIYGRQSSNNRIAHNTFENLDWEPLAFPFAGGILLRLDSNGNTVDHNDFGKSGLPGWTSATRDGPGAIMLGFGTTPSTFDNSVFEMKFPAGIGKTLCEMIWDLSDDPYTAEYDGTNEIHGWQPCENLAERDARKLLQATESNLLGAHW